MSARERRRTVIHRQTHNRRNTQISTIRDACDRVDFELNRTVAKDCFVTHHSAEVAPQFGDQTFIGACMMVGTAADRAVAAHRNHRAPIFVHAHDAESQLQVLL